MNAEQYVNAVAKKVKCGKDRKREIKKQLMADIETRMEQGERPEEIISRMGTAEEMADGFNETIPAAEQKQYKRNKTLKILFSIHVIVKNRD